MFDWILSIRFIYITREMRRINYYQWKYFSDHYERILFFKDVDISLEILSIVFTGKTRKLVNTQNTIMTWKIYKFFFLFFSSFSSNFFIGVLLAGAEVTLKIWLPQWHWLKISTMKMATRKGGLQDRYCGFVVWLDCRLR